VPGISEVRKRDGRVVEFDESKIANAIFKAAQAVGGQDRNLAEELAGVVTLFLEKRYPDSHPGIEDIQDMVEKVLIETGHARTGKAYILYRDERARRRQRLEVWKRSRGPADSTDILLLVEGEAKTSTFSWDRGRIMQALIKEADVDEDIADEIARGVEKRILKSGMERVSTGLIRELVDSELFERGLNTTIEKQTSIGIPKYDLDQIIFSKSNENSNISANNPEAVNLSIAERILKQYALASVYSAEVSEAHRQGRVHIHDLGYPTRVYCSSHSLEYLKKYGLHLGNLETGSAPAKHASVLTGHLNTFLASMQAYYAGALGVAYINIMYAPFIEKMSDEEMFQEAQHLIFSSSQNAFSRGGQTLFLDFNIHTGVPGYLKSVEAIGPGGKYTGRTYGDYAEAASRFTRAMLRVWRDGDETGRLFAFPKCDFHVNDESFADPHQYEILRFAAEIAAENGVPYFIFDRDEVTLSACCRLRTKIDQAYMIRHPESMRFCGFQNVTINLPQCAYRAGRGNMAGVREQIEQCMDLAMKAHVQKKRVAKELMSSPAMPLWEVGKPALDGRPYIDLDQATYIIGLIGLNECIEFLTGQELHDSDEAVFEGLKIIGHMYFKSKELGKKHGLKVSLEESPAESTSRRLVKTDLQYFPEQAAEIVKGDIDADTAYYTNSVHLRADANVDLITRITTQARFHAMIESGAIIHAFVGESRPNPDSIVTLVRKTFENTEAAQLTISPEFTLCRSCGKMSRGLVDVCSKCGASDVEGIGRIAGFDEVMPATSRQEVADLFTASAAGS